MPGHSGALARDFRANGRGARLASRLHREHGGDVGRWARSAGIDAGELIDFSASINPLGPPASARRAFAESVGEISRYPDPYGDKLKAALAARHGMDAAQVLVGNGSTQLIYLLCAALRPRKALVVGPAFSEYANALSLAGAQIRDWTVAVNDDFQFSPKRFMAAWEKDCDIAMVATPNSFTGRLVPKPALEKIAHAASARKNLLVVDEAFVDFVESESIKMMVRHNPYLLVLRSLTKYYALPGLRLGYLVGDERRIAEIAAFQEPWAINAPALNVALACLEDPQFATQTDRWLARERAFLSQQLTALGGFRAVPSQANFLLVKIESGNDALRLRTFLLGKKILIRACDSLAGLGGKYFRVAVRRRRDNLRLVAALREWRAALCG
jgi:threonine-phosphate decarboxylase